MKNYHASDEVIHETMEKLNKGQVKEGMLIYSRHSATISGKQLFDAKKYKLTIN